MKRVFQAVKRHFQNTYPYYVCTVISLVLLGMGIFRFPNAIGRLVESCKDFGKSVGYAFCEVFDIEPGIEPSVNNLPNYSYLNAKDWFYNLIGKSPASSKTPSTFIPMEWEQFKAKWVQYWKAFANERYFLMYVFFLLQVLYYVFLVVALCIPLWFGIRKLFRKYYFREKRKKQSKRLDCAPSPIDGQAQETPDTGEPVELPITESKPLRIWRWLYFKVILRVVLWFVGLFEWIKERPTLWQFWLLLALLYFNVITIAIEFIAYYLYFLVNMDVYHLYVQIYKLFLDLWAFVKFMPVIGWIIGAYILLDWWSKKKGYDRLYHNERKNRGFINELGVVTYIYAEMGAGKTTLLTDLALSMEVKLRDDALEIMLECDVCFPNFPWLKFERALKKAYQNHEIYDKWSCIRWINERRREFDENPCSETIFEYDIERYPLEHNNQLYVEYIWDTLQDYALAYTIYITQSALIVSNYSIRVDSIYMDLGNFPLWNQDFFKRDSRLLPAFSRFSHILDYDTIRLGNQMVKNNKNRYAFGWGVWIITEADKEFKNTLELQEIKAMTDECNQKNDLTHVLFKMSRHACYVRHRNMVRIGADMQRIENITANLRGVGQAALITPDKEEYNAVSWFSPYKLLSPLLLRLKNSFDNVHVDNRYLRADNRLLTSAIDKTRSWIGNWDESYTNRFGGYVVKIELQSGRMDGNTKTCKYVLQFKKNRAKRFESDCQAGTWESRGAQNFVGLDDMATYVDYMATQDELLSQNSYTQEELRKYAGGADMKEKTDIKAVDKLLSSTVEGLMQMQNGKIAANAETKAAMQTLVSSLCLTVADWANEKENAEETA